MSSPSDHDGARARQNRGAAAQELPLSLLPVQQVHDLHRRRGHVVLEHVAQRLKRGVRGRGGHSVRIEADPHERARALLLLPLLLLQRRSPEQPLRDPLHPFLLVLEAVARMLPLVDLKQEPYGVARQHKIDPGDVARCDVHGKLASQHAACRQTRHDGLRDPLFALFSSALASPSLAPRDPRGVVLVPGMPAEVIARPKHARAAGARPPFAPAGRGVRMHRPHVALHVLRERERGTAHGARVGFLLAVHGRVVAADVRWESKRLLALGTGVAAAWVFCCVVFHGFSRRHDDAVIALFTKKKRVVMSFLHRIIVIQETTHRILVIHTTSTRSGVLCLTGVCATISVDHELLSGFRFGGTAIRWGGNQTKQNTRRDRRARVRRHGSRRVQAQRVSRARGLRSRARERAYGWSRTQQPCA